MVGNSLHFVLNFRTLPLHHSLKHKTWRSCAARHRRKIFDYKLSGWKTVTNELNKAEYWAVTDLLNTPTNLCHNVMFMAIFTPGLQSCDGAINYSSRPAGGKVLVTLCCGSSGESVTQRVTSADNLVFSRCFSPTWRPPGKHTLPTHGGWKSALGGTVLTRSINTSLVEHFCSCHFCVQQQIKSRKQEISGSVRNREKLHC